jgi:arylsulfatase A-like enzyme
MKTTRMLAALWPLSKLWPVSSLWAAPTLCAVATLCALAALPGCGRAPGPHLVLVVVDTLRADRMSIYGHDRQTTPFLDSMAEQLAVYERYQAVAPWTVPTHASMFSGLAPAEHGAQWGHPVYADPRPTLAEVLQAHGYETLGLSANHFVSTKHGFSRGFDRFELLKRPPAERTRALLARADAWLANRSTRPLFLFVNLMDTHIPYATGTHAEEYGVEGSGPIVSAREKWQVSAGHRDFPDELKLQHTAAYDAAVRSADDAIAALDGMLERHGLGESSVFVVTSDHGDGLGQHAELGHSISVWEEQLAIPLLVRRPGVEGGRVSTRSSQLALMPSLLDWLGVPRPEHLREAASLADAPPAVTSDYRSYFSEQDRGKNRKMREQYPGLAARTPHMHVVYCGDYKLIVGSDGGARLFDLAADPDEARPLAMEGEQARACLAFHAQAVASGSLTPFASKLSEDELRRAREVYDEEALRALGYIE